MGALLVLAAIVIFAMLIVRLGAEALMRTGLSRDAAVFQSNSAFFGVGFTTREAELVVGHPVRRRIIRHLIIAGNVGVLSAMTSLLIAFLRNDPDGGLTDWQKALAIVGGVVMLAFIVRIRALQRVIDWTVATALAQAGSSLPADYELLLRVHHGFCISEIEVEADHWLVGQTLRQSLLHERGVLVLGITRSNGDFVGAPMAATDIQAEDVLTVYGIEDDVLRVVDPPRLAA